jgi:hypothetical protein
MNGNEAERSQFTETVSVGARQLQCLTTKFPAQSSREFPGPEGNYIVVTGNNSGRAEKAKIPASPGNAGRQRGLAVPYRRIGNVLVTPAICPRR